MKKFYFFKIILCSLATIGALTSFATEDNPHSLNKKNASNQSVLISHDTDIQKFRDKPPIKMIAINTTALVNTQSSERIQTNLRAHPEIQHLFVFVNNTDPHTINNTAKVLHTYLATHAQGRSMAVFSSKTSPTKVNEVKDFLNKAVIANTQSTARFSVLSRDAVPYNPCAAGLSCIQKSEAEQGYPDIDCYSILESNTGCAG